MTCLYVLCVQVQYANFMKRMSMWLEHPSVQFSFVWNCPTAAKFPEAILTLLSRHIDEELTWLFWQWHTEEVSHLFAIPSTLLHPDFLNLTLSRSLNAGCCIWAPSSLLTLEGTPFSLPQQISSLVQFLLKIVGVYFLRWLPTLFPD